MEVVARTKYDISLQLRFCESCAVKIQLEKICESTSFENMKSARESTRKGRTRLIIPENCEYGELVSQNISLLGSFYH